MFPAWTWVVAFWLGAAIGSFLNVVVYRLPRGLSIYKPQHSFCPSCQKRLSPRELIPILSWVFQKGRCSCGKNKIGARYVWVEIVTGTLFALIWYQQLVLQPNGLYSPLNVIHAVAYMLFAAALTAAIFTDLAHYIIPDQINAFMLVVGLGMNVATASYGFGEAYLWGLPSSIVGATVGTLSIWSITLIGRILFGKDAMGHGDIKMVRGIGAVLFPIGVALTVGIAVVLGAVIGGVLAAVRMRKLKQAESEEEEEGYEPESIRSILWCGIGYLLAIDAIGLVFPKLYEWWFGENPYSTEEFEEEPDVESTMIPFGPYLAVGALAVVLMRPQLDTAVKAYLNYVGLE